MVRRRRRTNYARRAGGNIWCAPIRDSSPYYSRVGTPLAASSSLTSPMPTSRLWKIPAASAALARVFPKTSVKCAAQPAPELATETEPAPALRREGASEPAHDALLGLSRRVHLSISGRHRPRAIWTSRNGYRRAPTGELSACCERTMSGRARGGSRASSNAPARIAQFHGFACGHCSEPANFRVQTSHRGAPPRFERRSASRRLRGPRPAAGAQRGRGRPGASAATRA